MSRTASWWVALLALMSFPASAEVRLKETVSGPELQVNATHRGIWSATGPVDANTLNPLGDLRGDGYPISGKVQDKLLVAWMRPSTEQIVLTVGDRGWTSELRRSTAAAASTPVVIGSRFGWMVAWSEGDDRAVRVLWVSLAGEPTALTVGDLSGEVVSGTVIGGSIHVLVRDGSRLLDLSFLVDIHDDPIIFATAPFTETAVLASVEPLMLPLLHGLSSAVVWWTSPSSLNFIELTEDGPVLPVRSLTAHGNGAKYPQSLVNEALRDLGR